MPKYVFILRKKDLEIELVSPDAEFISRQMKAWQELFIKGFSAKPQTVMPFSAEDKACEPGEITDKELEEEIILDEDDECALEDLDNILEESASIAEEISESIDENDIEQQGTINIDKLIAKPIHSEMNERQAQQVVEQAEDEIDFEDDQDLSFEEVEEIEPEEVEEHEEEESEDFSDEDYSPPPFEEYDLEQLEKEAVPASAMQTDYVNQLMADMESSSGSFEDSENDEVEEFSEEEVDLGELLAEAAQEEEDPDVRITQSDAEEELSDDSSDFSSLLEEFEADSSNEDEEDDTANALLNNIQAQLSSEEDEEDIDSLLSSLGADDMTQSEEEDSLLEEVMEEDPLLEGVLADEFDEEAVSEEDALLAALQAEAEEVEPEAPPAKQVPEAVQKIKQELEEKKQAEAIPIEAFYSSLTIKTPVDILLATAVYMEKFQNRLKFTQKDISALTFKAIKKPVSPNIILAAVNKNYIEVVPDFTGTSESNEYSLTETGRDYVLSELS